MSNVSKRDPVSVPFWGPVFPKNEKRGFQKSAKNHSQKNTRNGSQSGPHLRTKSLKMEVWNMHLNLRGPKVAQAPKIDSKWVPK